MRSDAGFSLVEILVVLALIVALAAVIAPAVTGSLDRARTEAAAAALENISTAIHDPTRGPGSFRNHVGRYPSRVSHLTQQITTGDEDSCGNPYGQMHVDAWDGPYLNRTVSSAGIPLDIGMIQDALVREPSIGGTAPVLKIRVRDVALEEARGLDREVDGTDDGFAEGAIRWQDAGGGLVTLDYLLPVKGC